MQSHLVPKIMHQKYPYFLRLLYYIQIGFIVFVPGHTGLIPMQFAFLSVPASVFFSFQFVLCFSLFETRRCVVVMSKDLKLNPSVLPVLLETRKCLFSLLRYTRKSCWRKKYKKKKVRTQKRKCVRSVGQHSLQGQIIIVRMVSSLTGFALIYNTVKCDVNCIFRNN